MNDVTHLLLCCYFLSRVFEFLSATAGSTQGQVWGEAAGE
jgi:hypothetical protein